MSNRESHGLPGLWKAVECGDISAIEALADDNENFGRSDDHRGYSVLHYAAQMGLNDVVIALLRGRGISELLEKFDDLSYTPLIWAAKQGHLTITKALLRAGADVNAREESKAGNTAIREAVESGSQEMVECLLDAGADPTIPGWMQTTALQKAEKRYLNQPNEENCRIVMRMRDASKRP